MIFALFLIAGIRSRTNLQTYEQVKNFFNPENTAFTERIPYGETENVYWYVFRFHLLVLNLCDRRHRLI